MPCVKTVRVRSNDEIVSLRDRIVADPATLAGCDLVHVLACDGEIGSTNYVGLRDWWRADVPVFAGRCFYQTPDAAKNPLQPQRSEIAGGFITECVSLADLPAAHRVAV